MSDKNNDSYSLLILDKEQFLKKYSAINKIDDEFCLDMLDKAFQEKDSENVDEAITLASVLNCFSNKFSSIFCKLLQENWHYKHEDIAGILQSLEDASTVDCLFSAAQLHFDYLDYDDSYQFARKCIKALSAINNAEAVNKLRLLSENSIKEIGQYAIKELRYKDLSK